MARDDFSKSTVDALRLRVGGRCSNPDCRRATTGPGSGPVSVSSVGVAAHIHAASKGGPRYLEMMSRAERRAIENGLWLCNICATKIDRDVVLFPANLLHAWKYSGESTARLEQGTRLPGNASAVNQLVMALTGNSQGFIATAVSNTHQASTIALENLDPRFHVKSQFINGKTKFDLIPRERVDFKVEVDPSVEAIWAERISALHELGETASLPLDGVKFSGSPLLESVTQESRSGTLVIAPSSRQAAFKLSFPFEDDIATDEFPGKLYRGASALRFEGKGYGGLVELTVQITRDVSKGCYCNFSFVVNFDAWDGAEIDRLPYFEKLKALLDQMKDAAPSLKIGFEVDGIVVIRPTNVDAGNPDCAAEWLNYLAYVQRARSLSMHTQTPLRLSRSPAFTSEDHSVLADAVDTFEGILSYGKNSLSRGPRALITASDDGEEFGAILSREEYSEFKWIEPASVIHVFGTEVALPRREVRLHDARPNVVAHKTTDAGREYDVVWEMGPDFRMNFSFLRP